MSQEIKLAKLTLNEGLNITVMAGAVFVGYQAASYFAQPWSLKDKKKGLTIHVGGFDGDVDFDIFGDLTQLVGVEEARIQKDLPLQEPGPRVTICGAPRSSKSIGLVRINFRKHGEVKGSAAIALKFSRGRIDVLPLPFVPYNVASAVAGRGGIDSEWRYDFDGLCDLPVDLSA